MGNGASFKHLNETMQSAATGLHRQGLVSNGDPRAWTSHKLRHVFDTEASESGVKAQIIEFFEGHVSGVHWVYNHREGRGRARRRGEKTPEDGGGPGNGESEVHSTSGLNWRPLRESDNFQARHIERTAASYADEPPYPQRHRLFRLHPLSPAAFLLA